MIGHIFIFNSKIRYKACFVGSMIAVTLVAGAMLTSARVNADNNNTVDEIGITVPSSCTMNGAIASGQEHTATINPNTYQADIGKTRMTTFCNDNGGYAIYAIGFTGDKYDGEDHTKLIGANTDQRIATGTAKAGNSQWAMRVTSIVGAYAPIIENGFDSADYHIVPDDYAKVATYGSTTDADGGIGSGIETTYAVYIGGTQAADTYTGKVKYTLVHPSIVTAVSPSRIGVLYHANGSSFAGGAMTNEVIYSVSPMHIGKTATVSKSPNVEGDASQSGGNSAGTDIYDTVMIPEAVKLKVVLRYDLSTDGHTQVSYIAGSNNSRDSSWEKLEGGGTGTETIYIEGDSVSFNTYVDEADGDSGDYGYYAQVYPIYTTEQADTEELPDMVTVAVDDGTYTTTTDWYGSWYADINGEHYDFLDETEIVNFLNENSMLLGGTNITLYRGLTFDEAYARAQKSKIGEYYAQQDLNRKMCNTVAITQNQILLDARDNNTYLAGRLKDGNCWMLDNLALNPTDPVTAANMNAGNTNATDEAIHNLLHGGSTATGWSRIAIADVDNNFGSFTSPEINDASKNTVVMSYGPGSGKVGIYYNFCAATVGTYCYADGRGVDKSNTLIDAEQDLCPANWRMPTSSTSGEYARLYSKYNLSKAATNSNSLQYNLSTPIAGLYFYSSIYGRGEYGNFWSSTYSGGSNMYRLGVTPSGFGTQLNLGRASGNNMRCLIGA